MPGQDMMLIMTKSISEGIGAGVCTASGVSLGLIIHTLIVSFGLGSLIMASEYVFWIIKLAGAAYLFYLAHNLLKSDGKINAVSGQKQYSSRISLFANGAVSNISYSKIMIFYLVFLPQFIKQGTTSPVIKMLTLGLTFACLTFLIKLPVALFSGLPLEWFKKICQP
ncbi:LysE family translocator [Enterobacter cancerogenus]|nr:LysE family translocator [Enterobacter cancerogenus]